MEDWIESKGSPFIIMDKKNAKKWTGLEHDYKIACSVVDYIGIININNYNALVLGDESMPIKLIFHEDCIYILRWMYATDNNYINKILKNDLTTLPIIEEIQINWESYELVLFDSVDTLEEADNIIQFAIKNKHCLVKTFHYEDADASLIIHQFINK